MPDRPADVGGGEHHLPRPDVEDRAHGQRHGHRVPADIALHALGLAGGAGGVEQIAGLVGFQPGDRHLRALETLAQGCVVEVPALAHGQVRVQAAAHHQHVRRGVLGFLAGGIDHGLVGDDLAAAHAGVGADQQRRPGIVDAQRQVVRGEAAEHHRMHRADARAGQDREHRLGHVRHVDDHAVALAHAQLAEDRGEGVHLRMQLAVGHLAGGVGLAGDGHQRQLVGPFGQVAVHRVVAQVGGAAGEPAPERRVVVLEDAFGRRVPVDGLGLFGPEGLRILDGTAIGLFVAHAATSRGGLRPRSA